MHALKQKTQYLHFLVFIFLSGHSSKYMYPIFSNDRIRIYIVKTFWFIIFDLLASMCNVCWIFILWQVHLISWNGKIHLTVICNIFVIFLCRHSLIKVRVFAIFKIISLEVFSFGWKQHTSSYVRKDTGQIPLTDVILPS